MCSHVVVGVLYTVCEFVTVFASRGIFPGCARDANALGKGVYTIRGEPIEDAISSFAHNTFAEWRAFQMSLIRWRKCIFLTFRHKCKEASNMIVICLTRGWVPKHTMSTSKTGRPEAIADTLGQIARLRHLDMPDWWPCTPVCYNRMSRPRISCSYLSDAWWGKTMWPMWICR